MGDTGRGGLETDLLAEMVEAVGVGVAVYDDTGRFRYVNEAYADILDTDPDSLIDVPFWRFVPDFDADRFERYWASFEGGETRIAEAEHVVDGGTIPVSTLTTRRRIDGTVYHVGTIRDITQKRERERELEAQNERLEAFAGIVSHDLRNPLGVAKGYLDLLNDDVDRDELESIEIALDRMDVLIEDLLTLARENRAVNDVEAVELDALVNDAWQQIESPAGTLEVADDLTVLADRTRLQQLCENLFRNAVEHTDGAVSIHVGPLGSEAGFFVADDGPGIPESKRAQVFEPSYSSKEDGTGFGLAIVQEIASAHGWSITLTESADGGSRFEFAGTDSVPDSPQ